VIIDNLGATGITSYLKMNGKLEMVLHIANHDSPRTTKLNEHQDEIPLDEVERITI
jgi:hypothetical protein